MSETLDRLEITLVTTLRRAERMALSLRMTESLLVRLLEDGLIADREDVEETEKRRLELLAIARWFEAAVEIMRPDLPPHERRKGNRKLVFCQREGCRKALTLAEARENPLCVACRGMVPA